MKVFFDTCVYTAEALLGGVTEQMFEATERASWRISASDYLLDEIERVLTEKLGFTSRLARLLAAIVSPDGGRVEFSYNPLEEVVQITHQKQVVHNYRRDKLGRVTLDTGRATVGTDPSADPAVKTKGGVGGPTTAYAPLLISTSLWDWHKSDKSQEVWGTDPPADYLAVALSFLRTSSRKM